MLMFFMLSVTAYASPVQLFAECEQFVSPGRRFTAEIMLDSDDITGILFDIALPDEISFNGIKLLQQGDLSYNADGSTVRVICLSDSVFKSGAIAEASFTAGKDADGEYTINLEAAQASNRDFETITLTSAGFTTDVTRSQNEPDSIKPASQRSYSTSSRTARSSSSKASVSSKTKATSSKKASSKKAATSSSKKSNETEDEPNLPTYGNFERYNDNSKLISKYVVAGALGAFCLVGAIFIAYRMGRVNQSLEDSRAIESDDDIDPKRQV